jgi:hypothetical protein
MQKTPATTDKPVMERGCALMLGLLLFWTFLGALLLFIAFTFRWFGL